MIIRWRWVKGTEKTYQVSHLGNVRSVDRYRLTQRGKTEFRRFYKGVRLNPTTDDDGYQLVTIGGKLRKVHRLVLEAFVSPCPPGLVCRHKDGNPANNKLENLSWGTQLRNQRDRKVHGTDPSRERNGRAKLTETDVQFIRDTYTGAYGQLRGFARQFGVHESTVGCILNHKTWR